MAPGRVTRGRAWRWEDDALCEDKPREWFFSERAAGEVNRGEDGKTVCAVCPVNRECLVAAITEKQQHGLWGGAGEPTRRRLGKLNPKGRAADSHPAGCTCEFCIAVTAHLESLARAFDPETGEPMHGRWEAFVHAGCRCKPCTLAHQQR